MLVLGASVQEVSDKLAVPKQSVSRWRELLPENVGQPGTKKEVIEDLLGQYLEATLRANLAQLKVFTDESWIRTQTAGELATLHGVIFDKAVRILDAAHRAGEQRQLPAAGSNAETGIIPEAAE